MNVAWMKLAELAMEMGQARRLQEELEAQKDRSLSGGFYRWGYPIMRGFFSRKIP